MARYEGDIRLRMETETDIRRDEKIRRGIRFSPSKPQLAERLELEALRDEAIAARIKRAAKNRRKQ